MSQFRRYLPLVTLVLAISSFYLYNLNGVGLLGPDEPRYAAIGRAMSTTGDWITPRLWGSAWFEKPPLLYWFTALATSLGAGPEISARLPVTLLSIVFLFIFCWLLWAEFGVIAAVVATAGLASSAGWIAYSFLCLTDLPLACFFALSVLLLLPLLRATQHPSRWRMVLSGACLGMSVLAKGLVPLVLILPAFWFLRRYWRQWWLAVAACLAVALPWYLLVYKSNGQAFIDDFFFKQHLQRFYSKSLEHVQPWYFYVPVLLGILFPWTPLFIWLRTRVTWDERRKFLMAIVALGMLFFSASLNKLPNYLLPLSPLLFALLGASFEGQVQLAIRKRWLLASALLVSLIPLVAQTLPAILSAGRIGALRPPRLSPTLVFYIALPLCVILVGRRSWAPILLVLCAIWGGFFVKITVFPILDERVSSRTFWNTRIEAISDNVCEEWIKRDWVYGLSFYRGQLIPPCYVHPERWRLIPHPGAVPEIVANSQ